MTDEELIARLRGDTPTMRPNRDWGWREDIDLVAVEAERKEAAAHIAALTAQVKALQDDLNGMASEGRRMRGEYNIAADHLAKAEAERDALRERVARLEGALVEHNDLLRSALSIAKREGVDGEIASTNWDAYYNRVAVVLKRHHQTANDARAALTDGGKDG